MLRPVEHISAQELQAGQRALVLDLAWASASGALAGGVILVAFALALGATPLQIGLLAAIPFITQALQLPSSLWIDRLRLRRRIGVLTITAARVVVLLTALLPFLDGPMLALGLLIASQALITGLNAVGGCAVNSWLHQLVPHHELGAFFSRRLLAGTILACVGTLVAGAIVERLGRTGSLGGYALVFALAALCGFISSAYLARAPEPQMKTAGPLGHPAQRLWAPFRHPNFKRLLIFLAAWTVAANLAGPFLTVYLIEQRGYAVTTVTQMWVTSQVANALTLYLWGRLSDRLSNKSVLAAVLPVHFACLLALVFVEGIDNAGTQMAVLFLIHAVMGVASGGIGLACGNIGLKLAPQGEGTAYLAAIGLASAAAGGLAPLLAGAMAQALQRRELAAVLRWIAPDGTTEVSLVSFAHWEFLFALSALLGLYVMHALSRIDEGRDISERQVVQEFAIEAWRSLGSLSSAGGSLGSLFPFERLTERRTWWRPRSQAPAGGWTGAPQRQAPARLGEPPS